MILINLDYQGRIPIYEQIATTIERYVALGILNTNEQIPSIRELASSLGINPNTVKKAYDLLEQKKVIVSMSTKGTFISNTTNQIVENKKKELVEDIKAKIIELNNLGISNKEIINLLQNNKLDLK